MSDLIALAITSLFLLATLEVDTRLSMSQENLK
jgi:hypothetical protein